LSTCPSTLTTLTKGGFDIFACSARLRDVSLLQGWDLDALLGDILDRLSPEELGWLPDPVWALLDFIARPDATEEAL
jgi:hypothetical protein